MRLLNLDHQRAFYHQIKFDLFAILLQDVLSSSHVLHACGHTQNAPITSENRATQNVELT